MSAKTFVWRGPATAVELWPLPSAEGDVAEGHAAAAAPVEPLLSAMVTTGQRLPPLDPEHPVVRGWIAFALVEEAKVEAEIAAPQPAALTGEDHPAEKIDG